MRISKSLQAVAAAVALVLGPGALVAAADGGSYVPFVGKIVFYYDLSSGSGNSNREWGTASNDRMCMDAPGSSSYATFVGNVKWHRTFLADPNMASAARAYRDSAYSSGQYYSASDREFYARATWNYSGDLAGQPSGYVEICG